MNSQINKLLQKRMDRKAFLKHLGIGLLAAVGLGAVMRAINPDVGSKGGYGSSVYGGKTEPKG